MFFQSSTMRVFALTPLLISLLACDSDDTQWHSIDDIADDEAVTENVNTESSVTPPESASEQLVISWPPIDDYNPFSTDPLLYEIWKNNKYIDTVETTSYVLTLDEDDDRQTCIQLRAVYGTRQSELSKPSCYSVSG